MISIGDFSTGVSFSAGGGVSGTPSAPSGTKWWDPTTWGSQEAGGMLLPPKQPAPAMTLPLASSTGFQNTSLTAIRAALAPSSGVVIKRPVSDGSTLGPATAGTPAAPPTLDRAGRYGDEPQPREAAGFPTAYLVGGAAVAAVAAFLILRRKG